MVRRENVENQPQVLTQEQVVAALEHLNAQQQQQQQQQQQLFDDKALLLEGHEELSNTKAYSNGCYVRNRVVSCWCGLCEFREQNPKQAFR